MYSVILHSSWVLLFWAIPWVCRDCFSLYYFWSTDPWPSFACKHSIGCPLYLFFAKPPFPSTHLSGTWSVLRLHGGIGPLAPVVAWTVKEEAAVSLKQNKTKQELLCVRLLPSSYCSSPWQSWLCLWQTFAACLSGARRCAGFWIPTWVIHSPGLQGTLSLVRWDR